MDQPPPQYVRANDQPNCQLIIIDKNKKINFYKICQIVCTEGIKEIYFKPVDKDFKRINASFDRCFVCQDRIVCINNSEADPCKYLLVFPSKKACSNIKSLIEENNINASSAESDKNKMFEDNFLIPILLETQQEKNKILEDKLKYILHDIKDYYESMKQANAIETTSTPDTPPEDENADKNEEEIEYTETFAVETTPDISSTNQGAPANNSMNEFDNQRRNLRKRARKNNGFYGESDADNFDDLDDTDTTTTTTKIIPPSKKSKKTVQNLEGKTIIKTPDYQIMEEKFADRIVKHLYIFDSADKKMCYKYTWNNYKQRFICNACNWKNISYVWAKMIQNKSGEECIVLGPKQHSCEIKEFQPQTEALQVLSNLTDSNNCNQNDDQEVVSERNLFSYKIMEEKFAGRNVKNLYVFDSDDKNMCYEYTWNNFKKLFICNSCSWKDLSNVWAKLIQDENGEECIQLGPKQHSCKLRKFQPQNIDDESILNSSSISSSSENDQNVNEPCLDNYKIVTQKYGGRDVKHLYVFDENESTLYYDLTWKQRMESYMCNRCMNRHHITVWAKLVKDENGKEILTKSQKEHECKLKKYK